MTLTARQRYWLRHIRACEASGKTTAAYAVEHGLSVEAMYAGKRLLIRKGVLPGQRIDRFQRVQVAVAPAQDMGGEWCIQLPNGVSVRFSGGVDAVGLGRILDVAGRQP